MAAGEGYLIRSARTAPRAAAFTLVESLLAIAIAMMVVAAIAVSHQSLRRALSASLWRAEPRTDLLQALDRLAAELRSAADPAADGRPALSAGVAPDGRWTLSFFARMRPPGEPDIRYARTFRLRYEAQPGADGRIALRREAALFDPRASDEWPLDGTPLARVRSWQVSFFDGERWRDQWPTGADGPRLPRAVRLQVEDVENRPAAVEAWIARDSVFTPAAAP